MNLFHADLSDDDCEFYFRHYVWLVFQKSYLQKVLQVTERNIVSERELRGDANDETAICNDQRNKRRACSSA